MNQLRSRLGRGDGLYERAVWAARSWAMYDLPWTSVYPRGAAVEAGQVIVVEVHHFDFWSLNPCRVVYVQPRVEPPPPARRGESREPEPDERSAFALGTLPGHSERGEERFCVERRGDDVWFEIFAIAGPRHWLTWPGYPLMRRLQRTFARATAAAAARAAGGGSGAPDSGAPAGRPARR